MLPTMKGNPAETGCVEYGTQTITYTVVRSNRTTLGLHVYPDGAVEVRAPHEAEANRISQKVRKRARWIAKQKRHFASFVRPEQPEKEYLAGETHHYLGKQYRIRLHPLTDETERMSERVDLVGRFYRVYTARPDDPARTKDLLTSWFKRQAKLVLQEQFEAGYECMRPYGVPKPEMEVRSMKKRWGSCTPSRRVLLNSELIHAPLYGIDYVVVHELCHLKHPYHSDAFYDLMSRVLPDWRKRKQRLERVQNRKPPL